MVEHTVGIYGLGRFGSFWAKSLAASGLKVIGYNRSKRALPEGVVSGSEAEVLSCNTLFYCVAISSFEEVLSHTAAKIGKHTLVFDTCSVKVEPLRTMERLLPRGCTFAGSHPMFGPDSASEGMDGLPVVLCPGRDDEGKVDFWRHHFSKMGLRVIEITADRHDKEAAYTQGITHVVGRILGELDLHESEIATSGYKRLLQVREQTCNDPLQLFIDLQRYNPYTHGMRMELTSALEQIMTLFAQADLPPDRP